MEKKNYTIDLLRFIFCIVIMLFHISGEIEGTPFNFGYMGVEFFFIVTGYYLTAHAMKVIRGAILSWKRNL